jgi:hypothetical protein
MEGSKTPARRTRRAASARPAPAAARKEVAKPRVAKPKARATMDAAASLTPEDRVRLVELAAYFRAERRGFEPGRDMEDWFAAEAEIEAQLAAVPEKKPARRPHKPSST